MLHPGRALPPLQKANSNYRDWVSDSNFTGALSPTATELPRTDGTCSFSQPQPPAPCHPVHAIAVSSAIACSLLLLLRRH